MVAPTDVNDQLKDALKAALLEILAERGDLIRDVVAEVVEEIALVRAMEEVEGSEEVSRDEIFRILDSIG